MAPLQKIPVDKNWTFKQSTTLNNSTATTFLHCAQFPTVAHLDLLHHGLIPDPYIDTNELDCLWVNDADWTYRTVLPPLPALGRRERAELVFAGLDTIVSVYLNGELILEGRNMHVSYRVDITRFLSKQQKNVLELRFKNAPEFAKKEMQRIGYKGNGTDVHFGGPERLFIRKAQYHWGWDWGPALNTCGPWKDVWLEVFEERIEELLVRQSVAEDLKSASVRISGKVDSASRTLILNVLDPNGQEILSQEAAVDGQGMFSAELNIENPELWYPWQYGSQPLYTVAAILPGFDTKLQKVGLRRLRLLQHPLDGAPGTSFTFEVNNIRIFCGGSNWIPGDCLLPRMTPSRYAAWLSLAKSGNQTMIRVWGGGIVESDTFYELCDELGLLVWQDFLFACGNYPASSDFVENVQTEAEQQVKRVGHHACLALLAGNNEDYMLAERWGWEYDPKDEKGCWDETDFPARVIYERTLPEVCERLAGEVPYVRSSPYGGKTSNDLTIGDTHIWDVWHGKMSPYQDYKAYTSRFISEFGFESAPDLRTLHKGITKPSERHWQSRTFDAHDKGPGHQRRYGLYAGENFRFRFNPLSDFVYCSQFLQAEAMKYAYNHWRRAFKRPGREGCSGVLVWQLNDIWPGCSWALVDVDMNPKAAFFTVKRALKKVVVGMERVVSGKAPYMVTGYSDPKRQVEVWAVSGLLKPLDAVLRLSAFDIVSGVSVPLSEELATKRVTLEPNRSNEIVKLDLPNADQTVVVAYLDDSKTGELLARWVDWPEPLKNVQFSKDVEVIAQAEDGGKRVVVRANRPVKGVMLEIAIGDGENAKWEDNFLDLVPGEEMTVGVDGLDGREVVVRWLCDWENEKGFEL